MADNLNQSESGNTETTDTTSVPKAVRAVHKCNFRAAGQLSNEQRRAVTSLHEAFARNTANVLGMHLRVEFEMKLASVDQMSFGDFVGAVRDVNYVVPLQLTEGNSSAMLQVDTNLVCTMIDVLLGGTGSAAERKRDLTEIDENIMEVISNAIARQLENAWKALQLTVSVAPCLSTEMLQRKFSSIEKMLLLAFDVKAAGTVGKCHVMVPSAVMNLLLRQSAGGSQKTRVRNFARPSLRERLMDCEFNSSVCLSRLPVTVRDLLALSPGSVLKLRVPVKNACVLMLEGRETFEAIPVRSGSQRAAQLTKPISQTPERMGSDDRT